MPEGDTLARIARTLGAVISGRVVVRCDSPLPAIARAGLVGHRALAVEARGKHLFVRFDDGRALHTHLRMEGAWHLYREGDAWKRGAHRARVVLAMGADGKNVDAVAVCFDAPIVALLSANEARAPRAIATLGPDLLAPDFDVAEARRRLRDRDDVAIGEAILDQRALAGIGNVYKSEVLFIRRANPFAPVARFDGAALDAIVHEARRLMIENTLRSDAGRVTRRGPGPRQFVYGRAGRPCLVCATRVETRRQGALGRTTYFCRKCQGVA